MNYIIYKITCKVNEKVYIGFTSKSAKTRFNQHMRDATRNDDLRKFYCAIRKYGTSNFTYEVLEKSDDFEYAYNTLEQKYIDLYDSIKNGYNTAQGGIGVPGKRKTIPVDLYDKNGNLLHSFKSLAQAAEFIGIMPSQMSSILGNYRKGRASQYKGIWIAEAGKPPIYKKPNTLPGCEAARKVNTGKKRPDHSEFLKQHMRDNPVAYYVIPEGKFLLQDAIKYYGRDMLIEWCRKAPNKVVTKMMIIKSKQLSLDTHSHWIGKTRAEIGFGYEDLRSDSVPIDEGVYSTANMVPTS